MWYHRSHHKMLKWKLLLVPYHLTSLAKLNSFRKTFENDKEWKWANVKCIQMEVSRMTWPQCASGLLCLVTHWFMGICWTQVSVLLLATLQCIYMQVNYNFCSWSWIYDGFEVLSGCNLLICTIRLYVCSDRVGWSRGMNIPFCSLFESLYHGHQLILFHHHYLVCLRYTLISLGGPLKMALN